MPIVAEKNPDPVINEIVSILLEKLTAIQNEYSSSNSINKELLKKIQEFATESAERISFSHLPHTLPEHLDERTDLLEVLETAKTLKHVIDQLLPGRIKYTISQLEEIKDKNNSEILKFVSD